MQGSRLVTLLPRICNILEFAGIILMLTIAFGLQIILHELPCPLCLLQRVGFLGVALGFLMNLWFGLRPSHYAMVILSALFTSFVALRQVALHVVPGSGSYGDPVLGLHLYTWSFIISMIVILVTTVIMSVDRQYQPANQSPHFLKVTHILFAVLTLLVSLNVVAVIFECGLKECPADPTHYLL